MPLRSISCVLLTVLEPTEAEFTLFQEGQRLVSLKINRFNHKLIIKIEFKFI
jgi:hypothetical protein